MDWHTFYANRMNDRYREHVATRYAPYLNAVVAAAQAFPYETVADYGCGAGFTARAIAQRTHRNPLVLLDKDEKVLALARENVDPVARRTGVYYLAKDFLHNYEMPCVGVSCGHGVLEHFSDADITRMLHRQLDFSRVVIHYVPTDRYEAPSFGDERLMPVKWWADKFSPNHWETFNDGHDLLMMWYGQQFMHHAI